MPLAPLQKLSITAGVVLVALGVVVGVSYYYASRRAAADLVVERANANLSAAFRVVMAQQDGERAAKAFVVRPDSASRAALQDAQAQVEDALDIMSRGTEDNPRQRALLGLLANGAASSFETFRATVLIRDRAGADSARRFLSSEPSVTVSDSLMKLASQMRNDELRVLAEQTRQQALFGATAQRLILVGMVFALLLAGLALQPLRDTVAARITSHLAREQLTDAAELAEAARIDAAASTAQLTGLHRLVAALAESRDAASAGRAISDEAVSRLGAALAAVVIPDRDGGLRVLAGSDALFGGISPAFARPITEVLRTGDAAMVESRHARDQLWGDVADLDAHGVTGSVLLAPMTWNGTAAGVLVIGRADDHVFSDNELSFAATLGRLAGQAVVSRLPAS